MFHSCAFLTLLNYTLFGTKRQGALRAEIEGGTAFREEKSGAGSRNEGMGEKFAGGRKPEGRSESLQSAYFTRREALEGPSLQGPSGTARLVPGGGLQIEKEGETYFVESAFSFPREGQRGENQLLCLPEAAGEERWKPQITGAGERLSAQAEGRWYRLERQVQWHGARSPGRTNGRRRCSSSTAGAGNARRKRPWNGLGRAIVSPSSCGIGGRLRWWSNPELPGSSGQADNVYVKCASAGFRKESPARTFAA